ncbi:hypothetical protein [Zooshikella sp. RANM57]|uniref:hypothetical protein n=1 Tax=Zooshikella sp. RANM57 TaxID=3425863 RepID=UPI003D6DC9DA
MKRFIFGLALVSMTAMSWAGQAETITPQDLCTEDVCNSIVTESDWKFPEAKKGGVIYGTMSYTFRLNNTPVAVRSSFGVDGGVTVLKLNNGYIGFTRLFKDGIDDIQAPFLYAFKTPVKKLPKKLPFDNNALVYSYMSKGMQEKNTTLKVYKQKNLAVIVGNNKEKTNIYVLDPLMPDSILHIVLAKEGVKYLDQILGTINHDIKN